LLSVAIWTVPAAAYFATHPALFCFGIPLAAMIAGTGLLHIAYFYLLQRGYSASARFEVIAVAILSPLTYILVLVALTIAPVTVVAPVRAVSIVIGTIVAGHLFVEHNRVRRAVAAVLMFAGVVALALV
jgi:hypothetical protein